MDPSSSTTMPISDEQILGPRLTRFVDISLGLALAIAFFSLTAVLSV